MDGHPISLDYVAHLDQMWVTCLIEMIEGAAKMAMMLRDAGKTQRHHPIHLQSDSGDTITAVSDVREDINGPDEPKLKILVFKDFTHFYSWHGS